jgi:hypothetical protein
MSSYDNTNRGAIFKNDKKGNDKAPEYKGTINIEGADYEIALWIQKSKDGSKTFFSTSQKLKEVQPEVKAAESKTVEVEETDLPF